MCENGFSISTTHKYLQSEIYTYHIIVKNDSNFLNQKIHQYHYYHDCKCDNSFLFQEVLVYMISLLLFKLNSDRVLNSVGVEFIHYFLQKLSSWSELHSLLNQKYQNGCNVLKYRAFVWVVCISLNQYPHK